MKPKIFVSYKRSDDKTLSWVRKLSDDLIEEYGIDTLLDQYDLQPGDSIYEYMQKIKTETTHVIFVITPAAVSALEENTGGISFEAQLWTALREQGKIKVIPILREGEQTASYVQAHLYIDFRKDSDYQSNLKRLVDVIKNRIPKPRLGTRTLQQFVSLSIVEKIELINDLKPADESSLSVLSMGLTDASRGVVGACLRCLRDKKMESDLLRDFQPAGMVWIPGGDFIIGDDDVSTSIHLPGFYIDKYPVTNSEYADFVSATNRPPPHYWVGSIPPPALAKHPVSYISFFDAISYADWIGMRLPTDAEWEKAASWDSEQGRRRKYPWGDSYDVKRFNFEEAGSGDTKEIGSYSPEGDSAFQVAEMYGNIREWTASLFSNSLLDAANSGDNEDSVSQRVVRGGSWNRLRTWGRVSVRPSHGPMPNSFYRFRCAFSNKYTQRG